MPSRSAISSSRSRVGMSTRTPSCTVASSRRVRRGMYRGFGSAVTGSWASFDRFATCVVGATPAGAVGVKTGSIASAGGAATAGAATAGAWTAVASTGVAWVSGAWISGTATAGGGGMSGRRGTTGSSLKSAAGRILLRNSGGAAGLWSLMSSPFLPKPRTRWRRCRLSGNRRTTGS